MVTDLVSTTTLIESDSPYLAFERVEVKGRKTPIVLIRSKSNHNRLGRIMWYAQWRQFCFYPDPDTIFNIGCMDDIHEVIDYLLEERKASA